VFGAICTQPREEVETVTPSARNTEQEKKRARVARKNGLIK
jgi:hypothetical protein